MKKNYIKHMKTENETQTAEVTATTPEGENTDAE